MTKKVLIAGIGQTNFLFQLYEPVATELKGEFDFSTFNLNYKSENEKKIADAIFIKNFQERSTNNRRLKSAFFFHVLFSRFFWLDLKLLELNELTFWSLNDLFTSHAKAIKEARYIKKNIVYDILHIHFPTNYHSGFTKYLDNKGKLILSFWGSDIYRDNNFSTINHQKNALKLASQITVTTPEMQFVLLAKFNFNLKSKTHILKFISQEAYFLASNKKDNHNSENFKIENNIPLDRKIIVFGHNASTHNNHLDFIKNVSLISKQALEKIHFVFPLSYGESEAGYIAEIKNKTKHLSCTYLEEFLEVNTLVQLKKLTNMYVHAPTTDGLSSYLTEYFYENVSCLVGSWLPYKTFKELGIGYNEFSDFDSITTMLPQLLLNNTVFNNRDIVQNNFRASALKEDWKFFYRSL